MNHCAPRKVYVSSSQPPTSGPNATIAPSAAPIVPVTARRLRPGTTSRAAARLNAATGTPRHRRPADHQQLAVLQARSPHPRDRIREPRIVIASWHAELGGEVVGTDGDHVHAVHRRDRVRDRDTGRGFHQDLHTHASSSAGFSTLAGVGRMPSCGTIAVWDRWPRGEWPQRRPIGARQRDRGREQAEHRYQQEPGRLYQPYPILLHDRPVHEHIRCYVPDHHGHPEPHPGRPNEQNQHGHHRIDEARLTKNTCTVTGQPEYTPNPPLAKSATCLRVPPRTQSHA